MQQILFIILICFIIVTLYSYLIDKFIRNKFLLFLPTIMSIIWFGYTLIDYLLHPLEGFGDLAIVVVGIITVTIIIANVVSSLIVIKKDKKE